MKIDIVIDIKHILDTSLTNREASPASVFNMSISPFTIVVCVDSNFGISKDGVIPWNYPKDRENFKIITTRGTKNLCIMGRKTFECINLKSFRVKRDIIVVSKTIKDTESAVAVVPDFPSALRWATKNRDPYDSIFICGGSSIYEEAIRHPAAEKVYINILNEDHECDNFVSSFNVVLSGKDGWQKSENNTGHDVYVRVNKFENDYNSLMKEIVETGDLRPNRTGVSTYSKFAQKLSYPLVDAFGRKLMPLLTTKRVSYKLVLSELLWIMNGKTDIEFLLENKNHIWDGNSTREFLDQRGLNDYEVGELGPVYGFQWRFFGSPYMTNKEFKETGVDSSEARLDLYRQQGYDQLAAVIHSIKNDPFGRRHVVSAWNPPQLKEMALPPCHFVFMFYVSCDNRASDNIPKYLSCHLVMRSNDMFLGHPFNVASYATLTHIIASMTGLIAKELVITMNDCHVYSNHLDQVKEQHSRTPFWFPTMDWSEEIEQKINNDTINLDDFSMDSIVISNYTCWKTIKASMAV